ncbi:hypothetical protein [Streptomyces kanamyceticus]|uniref:Uncharacterized protein n=1 Tax=Streptomyces kanamyceticus TaxID=1967 RepID=A0A5J6GIF0_STRKN|nr:hypothetical protein [Streptomyces kanamyceticus]QEU94833.1 hypothetical protein CP970_31625 [Streptomyces kanamyceticus]
MDRYFWHLSPSQARGLACVVCGVDLGKQMRHVPVGRDPATEQEVYACAEPCAVRIAEESERLAREMRESAGQADDSGLGADGEFGRLLRDLRILVGAEALLATVDDLATLRFLLQMAAVQSEQAMIRSRTLLARMTLREE